MSLYKKIREFMNDDLEESSTKKKEIKYQYPVEIEKARKIADINLKSDYCRNTKDGGCITYLSFDEIEERVVQVDGKIYYEFQVKDGDQSWYKNNTFYDGFFIKSDEKYLRCLVDVQSGEYIYFPHNRKNNKKIKEI